MTVYDSYTVGTGDISTTKSFSASLSVKKTETFSSDTECTVKELYVQSGDEVKEGDPLVLLSTGELFSASFDGVVNEIRVEVGDWIWPNFTVVQINDLQHLEVSMNVDEYDIEQLTLGEACTVSVISLGVDFETEIAHINRVSQSQGTVAFYSVTCDLTVPENVLPGMQATVTIPADGVTDVTPLAMAALAFDEDKKPYVLIRQDDGTYDKNYVTTALSDGMQVEITDGLTPGQTVYAAAGTESVQPTVTLESLYKMIVGETIVINDNSGRGGMSGTMPQMSDGTMPQMGDGTMPQWSGDGENAATPEIAQTADGTTATDATAADGTAATDGTPATDAAATQAPAGDATVTDGTMPSPPDGAQGFGGMTPPSGAATDETAQNVTDGQTDPTAASAPEDTTTSQEEENAHVE